MIRKIKLKKGFYPISISEIAKLSKSCEKWGYGNKDTCKYVAETIIEGIEIKYPDLEIREDLFDELVEATHDYNSGKLIKETDLLLPIKK